MATQIYELKTFNDLINATMEEVGIQSTDTTMKNRIKRDLNTVYLQEVIPYHQWKWLRREITRNHSAYISTGTLTVTNGSRSITFSSAPTRSVTGYWITIAGKEERYKIKSHTAGATAATLETNFLGSSSSSATYKLWSDRVALPADCKEVIQVSHDFHPYPIENRGYLAFKNIVVESPWQEDRPVYSTTTGYKDPDPSDSIGSLPTSATRSSAGYLKTIKFNTTLGADQDNLLVQEGDRIVISGAGDDSYNTTAVISSIFTTDNTNDTITYVGNADVTEGSTVDTGITIELENNAEYGERYRELILHPSLFDEDTLLHINYIRDATPLIEDDDEPLIPLEDRIVLLYGALERGWVKQRNPEESARNSGKFLTRLAQMKARFQDSPDSPYLIPSKKYLNDKRRMGRVVRWVAD